MIIRIVLSLIIVAGACVAGFYLYDLQESVCSVCNRPMHKVTTCRLSLSSGEVVEVCCPRCGLYFRRGRDDIEKSEVADFNSGVFLEAEKAYYVEGSSVHLCCSGGDVQKDRAGVQYERTWDRCLPSLVAFDTDEEAEQFIQKHGGTLTVYAELTIEDAEAR